MFREFRYALSRKNTAERMGTLFDQMLDHGLWMYQQAIAAWWRRRPRDGTQDAIYARDKVVNGLVREVRREVVRHLTVHPARDITLCLVLMSTAKDAERIGDYCKNILDASQVFQGDFHAAYYREPLEEITALIEPLFHQARRASREDDSDAGHEAFMGARDIGKRCDLILESLLRQKEGVPANEAVAYGLMCRYAKRIAAHLGNIASGSVAALENLDFGDEAHRGGDKKT